MANQRFIKTRSNYTLKKKHLDTDKGTIYERDYMTITGNGEGNFKFVTNTDPYFQKRHRIMIEDDYGKTNLYPSSGSVLKVKPDYESLKDFALYGSAVELVRSSINGIISGFPAAVIYSGEKLNNDYGIDLFSDDMGQNPDMNEMRYFCRSFLKYRVVVNPGGPGEKEYGIENWESSVTYNGVEEDYVPSEISGTCQELESEYKCTITYNQSDTITIRKIYDGQMNAWAYSVDNGCPQRWHIRPSMDEIKKAWNGFSEFQKILLTPDSVPVFASTFITPVETDLGTTYTRKRYIWPIYEGWNPDITGIGYKNYISELYSLAEYYDRYESDNLWRSMTHEAIHGLDWTFIREKDDEYGDGSIDNSRIKPVIRVWGRMFDDIKRGIDSIGSVNNITYDGKRNIPDCLLVDSLNLSGWDIRQAYPISKDLADSMNKNGLLYEDIVVDGLYAGDRSGKNCFDCNTEFLRRLRINSPYILSRKGTREGIREILSMFGMEEYRDYGIDEYVAVASGVYPSYGGASEKDLAYYNMRKDGFTPGNRNPFDGLPVGVYGNKDKEYVIPWFNNGEKYDDNAYFHMKGGWGRQEEKTVFNPVAGEGGESSTVTLKSSDGFNIFDETYPVVKVVDNIYELVKISWSELIEGEIVYVNDISGMASGYIQDGGNKVEDICDESSHYFILKDKRLNFNLGYIEIDEKNKGYGWKNIPLEAFDSSKWNDESNSEDILDAKRAIYMETLVEETAGNNPHNGYGNYDGGDSYFEQFKELLPARKFSTMTEDELKELEDKKFGYEIKEVEDDRKCYYFKDRSSTDTVFDYPDDVPEEYSKFFNPEGTENKKDDEAAANSVINSKKMTLSFIIPNIFASGSKQQGKSKSAEKDGDEYGYDKFCIDYERYVRDVVLFYVKQMVPSTTIFEYKFIRTDKVKVTGKDNTGCEADNSTIWLMNAVSTD